MLTQPLLLIVAAASVRAFYHDAVHPAHLAAKRDLHIAARQTQTASASNAGASASADVACLSSLASLYSALPTPPPQLESWEMSATITDLCDITVPASIAPAFSSYETEVLSWYSAHSAEVSSALSECPQFSSSPAMCSGSSAVVVVGSSSAMNSGSASATNTAQTTETTSTGTTSSTGSKSSGSASQTGSTTTSASAAASHTQNAGSRETGFVAGVVAVAGLVGVVAVL